VEAEKADHRANVMCRTLRVSKSGFYSWWDRCVQILRVFSQGVPSYGSPSTSPLSYVEYMVVMCSSKTLR